jgi:hypothetical protein
MKVRSVVALVGLAIGFVVPVLAQEKGTVAPEVRQQLEAIDLGPQPLLHLIAASLPLPQ